MSVSDSVEEEDGPDSVVSFPGSGELQRGVLRVHAWSGGAVHYCGNEKIVGLNNFIITELRLQAYSYHNYLLGLEFVL